MKHRIIPAILSGGAGTRLWPLSTEAFPKQFHALVGSGSLFQQTLNRLAGEIDSLSFAPPIVLGSARHAEALRQQLDGARMVASAIVLEPAARNTAAIAAVAAALAMEIDSQALVLLAPADHVVADAAAFYAAVARAAPFARERIVTFGIAPGRAATGYGYIERGGQLGDGVFEIASFREKPDEETARAYLEAGGYSWNSGMFLFHPATLLQEFAASAEIRDGALAALAKATRSGAEIRLDASYATVASLPLDIAVMEKTRRAAVVPCDIGWADIGSWDEIWRLSPKDGAGNVVSGRVAAIDAAGSLVRADGIKICVAGVRDLVVVATPEAVVIVPRERSQDIKLLRELAAKLGSE